VLRMAGAVALVLASVVSFGLDAGAQSSGGAKRGISVVPHRAVQYLDGILAVPGTRQYIREITFHRYTSPPRSILNRRIGRNRRFATQQYDLEELKRIGAAHDATLNDVFLAICGGGLRRFLSELDELPDSSLVAFVPVNVRPAGDEGGGNAVGAMLATLGTDIADPVERLQRISASTRSAKAQLEGMTQEAILAYSAYLLAPGGVQALAGFAGIPAPLPLSFNVCVSNVPGPRDPRYLRGARMEAYYPASIPIHGMALNITVLSYAGTLDVGFIGDRDALPHLQRLAVHTGEALTALDRAVAGDRRKGAAA